MTCTIQKYDQKDHESPISRISDSLMVFVAFSSCTNILLSSPPPPLFLIPLSLPPLLVLVLSFSTSPLYLPTPPNPTWTAEAASGVEISEGKKDDDDDDGREL